MLSTMVIKLGLSPSKKLVLFISWKPAADTAFGRG